MCFFWLAKRFHKRWFWDNQVPKAIVTLDVRNVGRIDIRRFFVNPDLEELQKIVRCIHDFSEVDKVRYLLVWVEGMVKPETDPGEFWQFPFETLRDRGDCEDYAILLANLLLAAGIEDWRVRLVAGPTSVGSHVWVEWFNGKRWVILDPVLHGMAREDYGEPWFLWNSKTCYARMENVEKWRVG